MFSLVELREELENIEDTRFEPYVAHLLAVMVRANEWSQIAEFARIKAAWLRRFLVLPHGIPSHDTIARVISMIDGGVLYSLCIQFLIRRVDILAATARERGRGG
jgi:DNA-binding phage protein